MTLVLVHGRDQQEENEALLKKAWCDSLTEGLTAQKLTLPNNLQIEFPFYAKILAERVQQLDTPLNEEIRTRGGAIDPNYQQFRGEVVEEIAQRAGVEKADVDQAYGDNPKRRGPQNWEWVQAILRAIDRRAPGIGSALVERFTRDVYVYLEDDITRERINTLVGKALKSKSAVVVGHSLGSVITYDVLRSAGVALQVPLYVTLGSPLGLRAIRNRLSPIKFPKPNVAKWLNAYDDRDPIALHPLDQANFDVRPDSIRPDVEIGLIQRM